MWNSSKLNRNYLTKMLDKQIEMKDEVIRGHRDESLTKYLDDISEKPSVSKKVLYGSKSWNKKNSLKNN